MITLKLASRLRDEGIVVISLHPGFLRTDMNPGRGDMDATEAATAIVDLVGRLTLEQSGSFLRWDGTIHPW
jgi:NAD(P)-dependent dehydrogenase (short-subunit alcohol dehydrogenase family)